MNKDSVVGGGYLRERGPTQAEFSSVGDPDRNTWGKSRDLRKVPGYERQSRNRAFIHYSSKRGVVGLNHQWPGDNLRILKLRCETHSCFDFKRFGDINFETEKIQSLKVGFAGLQFVGSWRQEKKAESARVTGYGSQRSACAPVDKAKSRTGNHGTGWVEKLTCQCARSSCLAR
jgi:hypothetical protein